MPPLIAPGICRFTVNQTYAGRNVANILDMQIDTTGSVGSRDDGINEVAQDILNNWDDHVNIQTANGYVAVSVSWVDLDSADGSTGFIQSSSTKNWPEASTSGAAGLSGNVAVLVSKVAPGGGRSSRNGRMYITAVPENVTDSANPNQLTPATVTARNAAFQSFLDGITDQSGEDPQRQLVVVHTRNDGTEQNPEIVYTGYSEVTALQVQPTLATQRRRLRS